MTDLTKYRWGYVVEPLKALIGDSQDRSCACKQAAAFLWYGPELYAQDPYEFRIVPGTQGQWTCAECTANKLRAAIERKQLGLDEVWPPVKQTGFATSFEC